MDGDLVAPGATLNAELSGSEPDEEELAEMEQELRELEAVERERAGQEGVINPGDVELRRGGAAPKPPSGMMPEHKVRKSRNGKAANTGPKGVKADYEEAKFIRQFKLLRAQMRRERELRKRAHGKTLFTAGDLAAGGSGADGKTPAMGQEGGGAEGKGGDSDEESDEESDSDLDDEDDAFFQKYKRDKINLIKNSLPTFGKFYRVERAAFIKETEDVHELAWVVVHLYENHLSPCIKLNLILEDLAPQFNHVKFIRVRSTDLVENFASVALPLLMLYRGGKVVKNLPRFHMMLKHKWEDADVVRQLAKEGVLNQALYKPPTDKAALRRRGADVDARSRDE